MENKGIPLRNINDPLKEHEKVILGASTNISGHMKGPWNHIYTSNISPASASYASDDNGYSKLSGFSWPPRLYICSFCKREFRSAQALGGHMNVHRRDRARLRQSPPASPSSPPELVSGLCPPMSTTVVDPISLNLIPNPNPNLIYSSTWMIQKASNITANYNDINHTSTIPSPKPSSPFIISSSAGATVSGMTRWSVSRPNPFATSSSTKTPNLLDAYNKEHNIPEVNIDKAREKGELLRLEFGTGVLRKEEVDLELRLGYSSYDNQIV